MIPEEALPHFENLIYLPMLLTVLSKDRQAFDNGICKFNEPYIKLIDKALAHVQGDLKQLIKGESEGIFTTYIFVYSGYDNQPRYLNVRLKNRTVELMELYLLG